MSARLDPRRAERVARAALSRLAEPGESKMTALADELGPVFLLEQLRARTAGEDLLDEVSLRAADTEGAEELARAERLGARFVIPGDAEWPEQLGHLRGAGELHRRGGVPLGLWVRGPLRLDALADSVAVVGSRSSTSYGEQVAGGIAAVVARAGHAVVSGGAFGIDQAAHRGAVAVEGPTVAVLACGVDRAYPVAHRGLLEHIAGIGAVVSEAPVGCSPMKARFLSRNRIIAGLARGVVVVEAATRSGALNTATWAQRLNRVLMGVPGPVTSASSGGVHRLVRDARAALVCDGAEVLEAVGGAGEHLLEETRDADGPRDLLPPRVRQVLDAVPVVQPAVEVSIARTAGIGLAEARAALLTLRSAGFVEGGRGGWRLDRTGPDVRSHHDGAP